MDVFIIDNSNKTEAHYKHFNLNKIMAQDANAANVQGTNAEVGNVVINNATVDVTSQGEVAVVDKYKAAIAELKKQGGKLIKGIKVKNCNVTEKNNYVMVSFTLGQDVEGYNANEQGVFERGERNVIFSSTFALAGMLKENDDLSWVANHLLTHPNIINLLFNGGTIDIVQLPVVAGQIYKNPFSTRNAESDPFDHDTIINHIIGVHLGRTGEKVADKLMDKLLGF